MKCIAAMCSEGEIHLKLHLAGLDLLHHRSTLQNFFQIIKEPQHQVLSGALIGMFAHPLQRKSVKSSLFTPSQSGICSTEVTLWRQQWNQEGSRALWCFSGCRVTGLGSVEQTIWWTRTVSRTCGTGEVCSVHCVMLRLWYLGTEALR